MMAQDQKALLAALEQGEIELRGQFVSGFNYTFLVTVHHEGNEYLAVYKPQKGEQPLWDFPQASLAGRERAAYLVSEALGLGLVPLTVLRNGPFGPGSLQRFVDHNPDYHYFNFKPSDRQRLRPLVLFDLLANNADRKGGHVMIEKRTRRLFSIDHGLCFHEEDKLRTVIWDFAGESIPPDLQAILADFRLRLAGPGLRGDLAAYLTEAELAALGSRLQALLNNPVYPFPPKDRRAVPYPPL
jgi:uncharacterized repeat protein (TIGR03843 family)